MRVRPRWAALVLAAVAVFDRISQWLTLYTTPIVYIYLDRLNTWMSKLFSGRQRPGAPSPTPSR
jgi:hypothetical protein